ncbi:MAG: hypothetical protein KME12_21230 [Trichocoleus desertorum ATA4-8-CV12]|nr:hypothetical protein [Trichocoleus desertorum ATA4-8-CV12]
MAGKELVELMMSVNLVLSFLHDAFNDPLVGAKVLQPVDSDSPLEVMKLVGEVGVLNDGIDRLMNDRVSFASFVFARFAGLSFALRSIPILVSDRGLRY